MTPRPHRHYSLGGYGLKSQTYPPLQGLTTFFVYNGDVTETEDLSGGRNTLLHSQSLPETRTCSHIWTLSSPAQKSPASSLTRSICLTPASFIPGGREAKEPVALKGRESPQSPGPEALRSGELARRWGWRAGLPPTGHNRPRLLLLPPANSPTDTALGHRTPGQRESSFCPLWPPASFSQS